VVVPGTEERIFEAADVDAMEERCADDFVGVFAKAIGGFSEKKGGSEAEEVEKN
jgi:hypothetical protein